MEEPLRNIRDTDNENSLVCFGYVKLVLRVNDRGIIDVNLSVSEQCIHINLFLLTWYYLFVYNLGFFQL